MKEILFQEIRLSLRDGGRFGMSLMLFFAIAFLIPLGIGPDITIHRLIAPGVLWVGVLLSSLLALDTLLARDHEDGTVKRLVSAPIPTEAVILSKIIAHWLLICFPLCLASPFAGLVMNLQFTDGVVAATTLFARHPGDQCHRRHRRRTDSWSQTRSSPASRPDCSCLHSHFDLRQRRCQPVDSRSVSFTIFRGACGNDSGNARDGTICCWRIAAVETLRSDL